MTDPLRVNADAAFNTAHVVANQAEKLREELQQLERQWQNLSGGWEGVAATAYTPAWDEWRDGAVKIVESLADEADTLARAAAAYEDQDASSAQTLDPDEMGL